MGLGQKASQFIAGLFSFLYTKNGDCKIDLAINFLRDNDLLPKETACIIVCIYIYNTLLPVEEKHRKFGNRQSVNRRYDVEQLWSDGNLVNGYWNPSNGKLYLNNGNRDNRNSDNGPREKFLHINPTTWSGFVLYILSIHLSFLIFQLTRLQF